MPLLTVEQQRDYVRRIQIGWQAASDNQAASVRARSGEETWDAANRVLGGWKDHCQRHTQMSGLVEQQRLFAKLHRR